DLKAAYVYEGPISAPVAEAQQIAYLKLTRKNGEVLEYPLFAGRRVSETGPLGRIAVAAQKLLAKPARPADAAARPE
ncbi:MAG: D-alanyl-D-alanine carboxypeptidase, partial [Pseudomonadota bacterium]